MDKSEDREEMIKDLNQAWELGLSDDITAEQLEEVLAEKLNSLIQSDFPALVRLLYRIDINEARLRNLLKENALEDAGKIIARLIIERQWQKILSRRQFKRPQADGPRRSGNPGSGEERSWPEEEKW